MQIRVLGAKERKRFDCLMGAYHYLGEGHAAGDTMRMVAELDGEWVGLLMWGSACYRLKPRDEFIGWTPTQRAQRQKLVVQNRRFLLLADRGEQPNLASHILGAAIRALPGLWYDAFGYQPLPAETFTDIEAFDDCEIKAAQRMIESHGDLSHTLTTADALHAQRRTAGSIVSRERRQAYLQPQCLH